MQAAVTIVPFLNKVSDLILNPLIYLLFSIALLVFIWGIVQFIRSDTSDTKRGEGKKKIVYGLIGMFVMFSAYGIVHLIVTIIPGADGNTGYINF